MLLEEVRAKERVGAFHVDHGSYLSSAAFRRRLQGFGVAGPGHRHRLADHLICVAPLVVVPTHDFDQVPVDDLGEIEIDDGRARIADNVGRNERITRYAEHLPAYLCVSASSVRIRFTSPTVVFREVTNVMSAIDPTGIGARTAMPSNRPAYPQRTRGRVRCARRGRHRGCCRSPTAAKALTRSIDDRLGRGICMHGPEPFVRHRSGCSVRRRQNLQSVRGSAG